MIQKLVKENIANIKATTYEKRVNKIVDEVIVNHKDLINRIDNLLPSEQDRSYVLFKLLLKRFIRKVYDISASEYHHDKDQFGLVRHTLEVIVNALTIQHKKIEFLYDSKGHLDSQKNVKNKDRIFFRVALNALIHDAGKIFDIEAYSEKSDEMFDPTLGSDAGCLLDFKLKYPDATVKWKKNRGDGHNNRGLIILFDILSNDDRQHLSAINWLQFVDQFLGYDPKDTVREIVIEADMKSVKESFGIEETDGEREHKKLIACFFATARDLVDKGVMHLNYKPELDKNPSILVQDTVSLIVYQTAVDKILKYMKPYHGMQTTTKHMISLLARSNTIVMAATGQPTIQGKFWGNGPDKKPMERQFIVVKNKYLFPDVLVERNTLKLELAEFQEDVPEATVTVQELRELMKESVEDAEAPEESSTSDNIKESGDSTNTNQKKEEQNIQNAAEPKEEVSEATLPPSKNTANKSAGDETEETINIYNTMDVDIKAQLSDILAKYQIGKKEMILIALNLVAKHLDSLKYIKKEKLRGTYVFVINNPLGFDELNKFTGILDIFKKDDSTETKSQYINSFVNGLRDTSNLMSFELEGGQKPQTQVSWDKEKWLKAIFVYEDSVKNAFIVKVSKKVKK